MTHLHITTWAIGIILFVVVLAFMRNEEKAKVAKITHMVLRLFYVLILLTGLDLFFRFYLDAPWSEISEALVKSLAGVWVIASMEMTLVRGKKGKSTFGGWVQLVIALILTIALGFGRLPMGILP